MQFVRRVSPFKSVVTASLLSLSIAVAAPAALTAQGAVSTQSVPPLQLPTRLSASTRVIIEKLADSLRQAGVPNEPLYDKAAEGVLKGADDARIVSAVRTLARELGVASNMFGPSASTSDVVSAASALRAGVPLAAAQKIAARRAKGAATDPRMAHSFIILTDLASRGVPVDAAVNAVDGLLARGAGEAELAAFRAGVVRDLQAGRDARSTLIIRAEGVLRRP